MGRAKGEDDANVLKPILVTFLNDTAGFIKYPKDRQYKGRDAAMLESEPYKTLFEQAQQISPSLAFNIACIQTSLISAISDATCFH